MAHTRIYCLLNIIIITFLALPYETESKWIEGTIKQDSDWVFITRFCFLSKVGNLNYYLEYPVGYGVQNMVFYYDIPGQWSSVYQRDLTCIEKVAVLLGGNQVPLTNTGSQCKTENRTDQVWYVCNGSMDFSTARERWWFVVLTRCGIPNNLTYMGKMYLKYKMHLTNGDDLLHKEFSADEFYILVIDIVFFILYIVLMVMAIICAAILRQRQLFHTTYKMYLFALTIWTIHLFIMVIAWGHYGTTGWEITHLEVTARILQTSSNIVFILMLILLAKGYTVVRGRLTNKAVLKITIFINVYIIAMVVMFIWEGVLFDPGLVLYYYESPPGYGMVTIILIGWLWFTKAAVFTLKHYSSKTLFYIAFYTLYTVWFWASPVVVLIAMYAMAKWTREKTVNGVQQFIGFVGHVIFLILTLPHKVNDNFPYHIRTTQIGTMNDGNEYSQADNMYSSSSGDSFAGVGPNLDIFITSKSFQSEDDSNGNRLYIPLETSSIESSSSPLSRFHLTNLPPVGSRFNERENSNIQNGVNIVSNTSTQQASNTSTQQASNTSTQQASNTSTQQIGNVDRDLVSQRNNRLQPLQKALNDSDYREQITLPPIRGTGLPSLMQTDAAVVDKDHTNMFKVL